MKIRAQFTATMLLFGIVLVIIEVSSIVTNEQVKRAGEQEKIAASIARGAGELSYLANEYLIYRESQHVKRWENRFSSFSALVDSLRVGRAEQKALVAKIRANKDQWKEVFESAVSLLNSPAGSREATLDLASFPVSWSRMSVQNLGLASDATQLSQLLGAQVDELQSRNMIVVYAMISVFVAFFLINYMMIQRRALKSIAILQAGAAVIGSGNLDFTLPVKKDDEIGDLSQAFNLMTADLKTVTASKSDLEREVAERKKAQEAMRQAFEAEEKANRAKSDFLATVSHELRTPLQAVIGFSELALEFNDPRRCAEYLGMIGDASLSLLGIINDILDLSRIEAGGLELDSARFNLRCEIDKLGAIFAHQAQRKGLRFSVSFGEDAPGWVVGDPLRVGQILTNMVGNALKFTECGEVALDVAIACGPCGRGTGELIPIRFTVRDTGIGIPEEKRELIFETFTQVRPGIARQYGGSGLGAAISRRLARMMGGDITFESCDGKGSSFFIDIPFASAAQEDDVPGAGEPKATFRTLSILVAEDNLFNQRLLSDTIAHWGHRAALAADGLEAVEKWRAEKFDMVLMDLMMPVMDGSEAVRRIRAMETAEGRDRTPVIGLTANAEASVRSRCLEAGMDDMVAKPVTVSLLGDLLGRYGAPGSASCREDSVAPTVNDLFDPGRLGAMINDPERVARYCRLLVQDIEREMGRLEEAFAAGDKNAVSHAAHALKGATLPIRGSAMSGLAQQLRAQAEEGDDERMAETFARLRDAGKELCNALKKVSGES